MAKIKLTKSAVDAAHPQTQVVELRDTLVPGFLCKVTPSGRKVFMLQYRPDDTNPCRHVPMFPAGNSTHLIVRGRDDTGKDLIIAGDFRHRAAELATEWLEPRTELEIQQTLGPEWNRSGRRAWIAPCNAKSARMDGCRSNASTNRRCNGARYRGKLDEHVAPLSVSRCCRKS